MPPFDHNTFEKFLDEKFGRTQDTLKRIEAHLATLNGQVKENSKFRDNAKLYFILLAVFGGGVGGTVGSGGKDVLEAIIQLIF